MTRQYALVSLETHTTSTVLDMVQSGRLDLGFAILNMRKSRQGNSEVLVSARMVGAVPIHHRLAKRKVLHPQDVAGASDCS